MLLTLRGRQMDDTPSRVRALPMLAHHELWRFGGEAHSGEPPCYSHSIVAGGFDVTSSTTRFTAGISLMIRDETSSIRSYGSRAQSAVIASSDVTARIAIG